MNLCRRGHDRDVVGVRIYQGQKRCNACLKVAWTVNNMRNTARKRRYDHSVKGKARDWRRRVKNPGVRDEYFKEWRRKHPEKVAEYSRRQEVKRKAAGGRNMLFWINQSRESL